MKTPSPSNWRELARFAAPYRGRMAAVALVALVGALIEAAFLVLLTTVGLALASGQTSLTPLPQSTLTLHQGLLIGIVLVILRLLLGLLAAHLTATLSAAVTADQRRSLSHGFLGTEWSIMQAEPSGRLQAILTGFVNQVTSAMTNLTSALTASLSLLAFMGTGLIVDPISTGAVLLALIVLGMILAPLRRRVRLHSRESLQAGLAFATSVSELGSLGQEMHTFGVRRQFTSVIDALSTATTETQRRVQVMNSSMTPVYTSLAYFSVLGGVGTLSLAGTGNLASIGAVMLLMLRSLSYGQQLVTMAGALSASGPFLHEVQLIIQNYAEHRAPEGGMTPPQATPISLDHVSFSYASHREALKDLTFTIMPGESIGIIGPSGSGKSTLAQILLGLRPPSSGSVLIDEIDLKHVDRDWWTSRVAFVPQDPLLITGSVEENLRFYRSGLDDAALRTAAHQANILTEIDSLPHGIKTHLGERGSQLSGGQRQRLSIARALAGNPEVLILDEPTSALDGKSELLIRDTLRALRGRVTVITIAHRMSTLDICDRILVIEQGRVTGWDTPASLRATNAFYQRALEVAGVMDSDPAKDPLIGE